VVQPHADVDHLPIERLTSEQVVVSRHGEAIVGVFTDDECDKTLGPDGKGPRHPSILVGDDVQMERDQSAASSSTGTFPTLVDSGAGMQPGRTL
jgi:hypothetical protein